MEKLFIFKGQKEAYDVVDKFYRDGGKEGHEPAHVKDAQKKLYDFQQIRLRLKAECWYLD